MATADETLDLWLRDAHAMEEQAEHMLGALVGRIENYPNLKRRVQEHLEETRHQAKQIRACLERRGCSTSALKDAAGKIMATMRGASGVLACDEIMKGTLASYTFEQMEIISYRVLAEAARMVDDAETERVCVEIMAEEEAMANWLLENSTTIAHQYLAREELEMEEAKR